MDDAALRSYLDGHLTGARSVTKLVSRRLDEGEGPPWLATFRAHVEEELEVVEGIADRLDAPSPIPTHVVGMALHASVRAALRVAEARHDPLRDLLEFEVLFLGVQGKAALWRTLRQLTHHPAVAPVDLDLLEERAAEHASRLEGLRLEAAGRFGEA